MKILTKNWLILGVSLFLAECCFAKNILSIKVGTVAFPPLISCEKSPCEKPEGIIPDYLNKLAHLQKLKIIWIPELPQSRMQMMLEKGEIDIGVAGPKDPHSHYKYSESPIGTSRDILFVRSDETLSTLSGIEDLKGRRIGRYLGVRIPEFLDRNRNELSFIDATQGEEGPAQLLNQLISGRAWAIYSPSPESLIIYAAKAKLLNKIKVLKLPNSPRKDYFLLLRQNLPVEIERRINSGMTTLGPVNPDVNGVKKICALYNMREKCAELLQ